MSTRHKTPVSCPQDTRLLETISAMQSSPAFLRQMLSLETACPTPASCASGTADQWHESLKAANLAAHSPSKC
eukprot:scaffold75904_cov21-Tisochrysis_lutea.AAC.1